MLLMRSNVSIELYTLSSYALRVFASDEQTIGVQVSVLSVLVQTERQSEATHAVPFTQQRRIQIVSTIRN